MSGRVWILSAIGCLALQNEKGFGPEKSEMDAVHYPDLINGASWFSVGEHHFQE